MAHRWITHVADRPRASSGQYSDILSAGTVLNFTEVAYLWTQWRHRRLPGGLEAGGHRVADRPGTPYRITYCVISNRPSTAEPVLVDSAPLTVILYTCRRRPVSTPGVGGCADRRVSPPHRDLLLPRVCCVGVVFRGFQSQGSRGLRLSGRRKTR